MKSDHFTKLVEKSLSSNGWKIIPNFSERQDFEICSGKIVYLIKCLDEAILSFKSLSDIIYKLEYDSDFLRSRSNRILIVILSKNFLMIELKELLNRNIIVLLFSEIETISALAAVGNSYPNELTDQQIYLLKRNLEYAVFVATRYKAAGNFASAIEWARAAHDVSSGLTMAHMCLFNILRESGNLSDAQVIGEEMLGYRSDDPAILRGMAQLAKQQGDFISQQKWETKISSDQIKPRTFEAIIASQSAYNKSIVARKIGCADSKVESDTDEKKKRFNKITKLRKLLFR